MKIIVGLGNPGKKYLFTRHNLGFMLIDSLVKNPSFQTQHQSLIQKENFIDEPVLFVKPQTFMNLSGQAVKKVMNFYKTPLENLLVIQDDKDQMFGKLKFQKSRGHGGHKGIENIHQELNSQDYCRLKIGVAPSKDDSSQEIKDTSQFVLSFFNKEEQKKLPNLLEQGHQAISCFIKQGMLSAANQFNSQDLD